MAELDTAPATTEEVAGPRILCDKRHLQHVGAIVSCSSIGLSIALALGIWPGSPIRLQSRPYLTAAFQACLAAWAVIRMGRVSAVLADPHLRMEMALTGVAPAQFLRDQSRESVVAALKPLVLSAILSLMISRVDEAMSSVSLLITVAALCLLFHLRCAQGNRAPVSVLSVGIPIAAAIGSLTTSDSFLRFLALGAGTNNQSPLQTGEAWLKGALISTRVLLGVLLFLSAAQMWLPLSWTAWRKSAPRPYRTALCLAVAACCAIAALLAPREAIHGHNDAYQAYSGLWFLEWLDGVESAHLVICASTASAMGLLISCFATRSPGPFQLPTVIVGGVSIAVAACMPCVGPREVSPILLCPPIVGVALYMAKDLRRGWSALLGIVLLALTVFLGVYTGLALKAWSLSDPTIYRSLHALPTELLLLTFIAVAVYMTAKRLEKTPPLLVPLAAAVLIEIGEWTPLQQLTAVACIFAIRTLLRRIERDYFTVH